MGVEQAGYSSAFGVLSTDAGAGEQSQREAQKWIEELCKRGELKEKVSVHVLMGGVEAEEWYLEPEKPAVLIAPGHAPVAGAESRVRGEPFPLAD